ncbi:class I SAM-dependent DNA methyltransferase [Pseudonocardia sp. GCM10023141]|uniref:class I SAM-dependent DNA methyltransferase n=1 Tax=Pseudonocardia sp. GCM10023141 TaxID=3252653 RepID=UPI0036209699
MDGFDRNAYGDRWAADYDTLHEGKVDADATVAGLSELAGPGGSVLEYGAGTGRIAIPLAARGHDVVGVEISEAMLVELRAKPGSDAVTAVLGDMTTVELGRTFDLACVPFNSIFTLPTQDDQVELFRNAAMHLRPGGRFALESVMTGDKPGSGPVPRLRVADVGADRMVLAGGVLDPITQFYQGTWAVLGPNGTTFYPLQGRHVTHAEMDLMARIAGLELEHRLADWTRAAVTPWSRQHVSVYRRPG